MQKKLMSPKNQRRGNELSSDYRKQYDRLVFDGSLSRYSQGAITPFPKSSQTPTPANLWRKSLDPHASQFISVIVWDLISCCIRSFESELLARDDRSCGCRLRICFPTHGTCWNLLVLVFELSRVFTYHLLCMRISDNRCARCQFLFCRSCKSWSMWRMDF
jgi:hypothetical protein